MKTRFPSSRAWVLAISTFPAALLLILGGAAFGQGVPNAISYQGKLTDSSGQIVPDGSYPAQFKLYDVETLGTAFWTSSAGSVTASGGVFTTWLQGGTPTLTPSLLSSKTNVWLEVLIGTPSTALPRVRLASVPFAFRSDDLTLPFAGTVASASPGIMVANTGTGNALEVVVDGGGNAIKAVVDGLTSEGCAGYFSVLGSNNKSPAVYITNAGKARALEVSSVQGGVARFSSGITAGTNTALEVETSSLGHAGEFLNSNSDNTGAALHIETNGPGYALYAKSTHADGKAGYFEGNVHVTGQITSGSGSSWDPVAYGTIQNDGTIGAGTPNVSSYWDLSNSWYVITISGHTYQTPAYGAVATPILSSVGLPPRLIGTFASAGKLFVVVHDLTGARVQCNFTFVVYKP